ncbi:winged helix-turn-helix transcriptional regulator, partial [Escherichia coli]|nr:winged helix-turn-helix transcriptional regulator [Escherichia coli]
VPPRVDYTVTDLGRTLKPTLDSLADWMRTHGETVAIFEMRSADHPE